MARARKEGKQKRNRSNLVKNIKRIQKVDELIQKIKDDEIIIDFGKLFPT